MITLNSKLKNIDYMAILLCVTTLAFHDKKYLVIPMQISFIFCTFLPSLRTGKLKISKSIRPYIFRYLLFVGLCLLSYVWSINKSTWVQINISVLQCVLVGISIILYGKNLKNVNLILNAIVFASLILCMRLIITTPLSVWGAERVGVLIGYGNVGVSYVLATAATITIYKAITEKKLLHYVLTVLFIIISALSGSKKGLIIFIIGFIFIVLKKTRNPLKLIRNCLLILAVIILLYISIMKIDVLYSAIGQRFEAAIGQLTGSVVDKSTRDRSLLIKWGFQTFLENPIIGVGIDGFRFSENNLIHYYAHNNYIELLANLGLVGFAIYYYSLFKLAIKGILSKMKIDDITTLGIAIIISLMVGDYVSISYSQEYLQLYIAVAIAIITCKKGEEKNEI